MWINNELGNRLQSFRFDRNKEVSEKEETAESERSLMVISVESNVMCWNPSFSESISQDEKEDLGKNGKGWIFSAPSTPRFVAAEILKKGFVVAIHSCSQEQSTKDAIMRIVEEIINAGGDAGKIVGISGGNTVEATSFCIVNHGTLFVDYSPPQKINVFICPSWKDESVEFRKVENGTNSLFFTRQTKLMTPVHFFEKLIDQLKFRHSSGFNFIEQVRKEDCKEINPFENAFEITSSHEAAFDCVVGNLSNVSAIIMCGHPGGELEMATRKLIFKIETNTESTPSIFDQKACIGLKAGIKKYEERLSSDLKSGKKIIFASSNVRSSEREFLREIVNAKAKKTDKEVITALITKPSWWFNSKSSESPLSHLSLRSNCILFDPPDCEREKNVVRLI